MAAVAAVEPVRRREGGEALGADVPDADKLDDDALRVDRIDLVRRAKLGADASHGDGEEVVDGEEDDGRARGHAGLDREDGQKDKADGDADGGEAVRQGLVGIVDRRLMAEDVLPHVGKMAAGGDESDDGEGEPGAGGLLV